LIAEDSLIVRERLVALAREYLPASSICSVATGADALLVFDRSNPDAVLLDLGLPDITGLEVLEHIRRRGTATEVIVFTNWAGPEMAARCHLLGANHFVSKAHDVGPVIQILRTITLAARDPSSAKSLPAPSTPVAEPRRPEHSSSLANPVSVLVVEDDRAQADLLVKLLGPKLPQGSFISSARSKAAAVECVTKGIFEVVLLDLGLPDSEGVEVVAALRGASNDLAIVVLSSHDGDGTIDSAMQAGADDYFVKGELSVAALGRAVVAVAKRRRSARALTTALASRQRIMDSSADVICTLDSAGRFVEVGAACQRVWGYTREELIGRLSTQWAAAEERSSNDDFLAAIRDGGAPHGFENRFLRSDGSIAEMRWSAVWSPTDRLMYCVGRDITERKRNEETLSATITSALDCIITVDENNAILEFNPAAENTFGWTRSEALGRQLTELIIPPEFREGHSRVMTQLLAGTESSLLGKRIEIRTMHSNGTEFPAELSLVRVGSGQPARFTAFLRGITERVSAREKLEAQEEQYRVLFESNPNAMWVYGLDDLRILATNDAAVAQYGYSHEEFLGLTLFALRPPEDREIVKAAISAEGAAARHAGTWRHLRKDGSLIMVDVYSSPTTFEGAPARMAVLLNVTEQKRAEEALRRSEERYGLVVSGSNAGIFDDDLLTGETYYSPRFREILGFPPDYAPNLTAFLSDVVHPDDRELTKAAVEQHLATRVPYAITFRLRTQSGGLRWCNAYGRALWDTSGKPFRMAGSITDITEQKQAEAALRASEERFSSAFEFAPMGMALVNPDGRWVKVNQALCELLGYPASELTGKYFHDVTHPDSHAADAVMMAELLAGEVQYHHTEKRYLHKAGDVVWVSLGVSLVRDREGQPLHFISQIQDITARKTAEAAAAKSDAEQRVLAAQLQSETERLVAAQAVAKIGSWETDLSNQTVLWSAETFRIFELERGTGLHTPELFSRAVHPADRAAVDEAFALSLHTRTPSAIEHRIVTPDGRVKFVEERWQIDRAEDGTPLRSNGTCQDITERKHAEKAAGRMLQRLHQAQRIGQIGDWDWDIATQAITWSPQVFEILGCDPSVGPPRSYDEYAGLYDTENATLLRDSVTAAITSGEGQEHELRIVRADGQRVDIQGVVVPRKDQTGRVIGLSGTIQDITARKQTEAAASRLLSVLEASLNEIYIFDADTLRFEYVNECALRNLGYAMDEMREKTPLDLKPEFTADLFHQLIAPLRRHEIPKAVFETAHRRADTSLYPVEVHLQLVARAGTDVFLAVINDITSRKRAEEELRQKDSLIRIASRITETGGWALQINEQRVVWSDEVCDILEYPRGAVPSLTEALALYPHPWREVVQAGLKACARDGTPFDAEVEVLSATGRRISVRLCCEAERDAAGVIARVQGAFQDISRRRRAEAALRDAHAKYRSLVENAVEGIFQTTPDGVFLSANPALARMAGFESPEELIRQRNNLEQHSHADPVRLQEFNSLMEAQGFVHEFEYETKRKDGSILSVSESTRVVRDDAGHALYYEGSARDITDRKRAAKELEALNRQLVETSRQAGMAEVATSVLHNVGNVLNSVNVSCSVISDTVRKSRISTVNKTADLLRQHADDLPAFLTTDPAGKKLPELLGKLAQRLADEQATVLSEAQALTQNVQHIKEIVAVQQTYAGNIGGVRETVGLDMLMEDALRMNSSLLQHRIEVVREFSAVPTISLEKHKVLQILVNLIRNAKHALTDSGREDKRLVLRIAGSDGDVAVTVADNGIGIAPENMTRIFAHGFTTKKDGHGFGLHSGAVAAQEMGGSLTVHSDGLGHGAIFTLTLKAPAPSAKRISHLAEVATS
jgi:PAS domain S-box-containing protein